MAYCILIRHGRSTANTQGVLAGWTEGVALDETGREQAERLVTRLGETPVVHLATSPLQRCRETADPLLAHARRRASGPRERQRVPGRTLRVLQRRY